MTTKLNEPKAPIRIDVVQKQFKNGMKLTQLARLYEVDEETLKPIVAEVVPKKRKEVKGRISPTHFSKEELIDLLERHPVASTFKQQAGIESTKQMNELLETHGLSHMVKTQKQVLEERYVKIIELLEAGETYEGIKRRMNTGNHSIYAAIKYFGREDLKRIRNEGRTPEELQALAEQIREFVDTKTTKEITSELGINVTLFHQIRKEHGIKAAKRPPRTHNWNNSRIKTLPTGERTGKRARQSNPKYDYEQLAKQIAPMLEGGMVIDDILKEVNISLGTYYKIREKHGADWKTKRGRRKGQTRDAVHQAKKEKKTSAPLLIIPDEPKEEPPVKETTTASLESAVTAFKAEEVSELIGSVQKHIEHKKPSTRIINRDKDVWAEYLTARSEEIHDVAHTVDVVLEEGKLIERTVLSYTLEREVTR